MGGSSPLRAAFIVCVSGSELESHDQCEADADAAAAAADCWAVVCCCLLLVVVVVVVFGEHGALDWEEREDEDEDEDEDNEEAEKLDVGGDMPMLSGGSIEDVVDDEAIVDDDGVVSRRGGGSSCMALAMDGDEALLLDVLLVLEASVVWRRPMCGAGKSFVGAEDEAVTAAAAAAAAATAAACWAASMKWWLSGWANSDEK